VVTIVSATSAFFMERAERFLKAENFGRPEIRFRRWLIDGPAVEFKMETIAAILKANADRHAVVVMDNSRDSNAIAARLRPEFGSRIAAVYLRETVEGSGAESAVLFTTAYDIAVAEFKAARLERVDVEAVAHAISIEPDESRIIPRFSYCPREYYPCIAMHEGDVRSCSVVREKVRSICRAREAQ
jgi:hypothetical protein